MITVDKAWKTNSWKTNQAEFFAFDKFTLQTLANKSGCVQTNLLYFKYTSHLRRKSTMRCCFYHTDLVQNAAFHNFSRQIAFIQYFGPHGLLTKPFKKFPKSPIWPASSNFWHALYLWRNLKELRFNMIKNLLCVFFY